MKEDVLSSEELQRICEQKIMRIKEAMGKTPPPQKKEVNVAQRKWIAQRIAKISGVSIPVDLKS